MFHPVSSEVHRDDKRRPGTGDVFVSEGWAKPNEALEKNTTIRSQIVVFTPSCGHLEDDKAQDLRFSLKVRAFRTPVLMHQDV